MACIINGPTTRPEVSANLSLTDVKMENWPFVLLSRLTLLYHQVHRLSAKVVREPLFPWVPRGATGEKDKVKAQESVREQNQNWKKEENREGKSNERDGETEEWGNGPAETVARHMKKRPCWRTKSSVSCADTWTDPSLQQESLAPPQCVRDQSLHW